MFEPLYILIHIFGNLNISIMTMLSFSKVSFSLCRFEVLRTYFSIGITNAFCVCNMVKHVRKTYIKRDTLERKKREKGIKRRDEVVDNHQEIEEERNVHPHDVCILILWFSNSS
jgi:hypothetical protein